MAEYAKGYGKRPLWQWVAIYLVIGGIVYALVYYFILAKPGGMNYGAPATSTGTQQSPPSGGTTQPQTPSYPAY